MSEAAGSMKNTRAAMIAMFVVAVGMLIGAVSVYTKAYNQAAEDAEKRALKPQTPPLTKPGEKEQEQAKTSSSLGEAFSIASSNPWFWWTLLGSVILAGLGSFYLVRKPVTIADAQSQEVDDRQWGKLGFFAMFSLIGFLTVACLAIPYTWMHSAKLLSRQGWSFSADNPDRWIPILIVLAYVLGLGSMFASLLAVKSEERTNAALRRWIYGYNAFLGALLFLAILGVINAFFALYGPEPSDWTSTNIYSLSPATKRLVKSLEKPVRVYVMLSPSTALEQDVLGTLNNCKSLSSQLEIVDLPLIRTNFREIDALIKKYDVLRDASGLVQGLLLVQDPNSEKPLTTLLKQEDLEEVTGGRGGMDSGQRFYKGEQAFYSALREFRQEKKKQTIYFTQDSGELSIDDSVTRAQRGSAIARAAGNLKQRLEKAGYVVKPLNLGQLEADGKTYSKVPDDAMLVIVADPLRMTPEKAGVLDAYMKRPKKDGVDAGKLIVLLDPHYGPDNKVAFTGLETLLGTYGVQVGRDVLYTISRTDPTEVSVVPAGMVTNMPVDPDIAQSLEGLITQTTTGFEFREARSIKTVPANVSFDTRGLLISIAQDIPTPTGRRMLVWTEDTNIPNPMEYMKKLIESKDFIKKLDAPIPPTVAVSVREKGANQPPPNPMMPPPPGKLGDPRMIVFGDATFATDGESQKSGQVGVNVMLACVAWCQGKPELDSGDVTPRERRAYKLNMSSDTLNRVIWLPPIWLLLAVILLGVGVAILRRK